LIPSPQNGKSRLSSLALAQTIGYFAGFVVLGLFASAVGPTLPGLAANTGAALAQVSWLFTARSFGYLVGSQRGGRLLDRLPGNRVLLVVLLLMSLAYFLVPVVTQLWILVGLMLLVGASVATLDVGCNALLVWVHRRGVGPYMSAMHFFFGVGAFIGPIIVGQVIGATGKVTGAYWIVAACALPVAFWLSRLRSPEPELEGQGNGRGASAQESPRLLLGLIVLFAFLYVGAEVAFAGWIFTYATRLDMLYGAKAAYLTSLFWGAFTAGRLVGIPVAARFRAQAILSADLAGCLVSLGVLLIWPGSLAVVVLSTAGLGFFMASIFPTLIVWTERQMTLTGRTTGWMFTGAGAGGMFLPWLVGQLFERVGPPVMTWIILVDLLACALVYAVLVAYSGSLRRQPRAV
jgi:MFS transporter, FHS family, Na+ dependent glucose transporter 1